MYSYRQALDGVSAFEEVQYKSVAFSNLLEFTNRLIVTIGQHEAGSEAMRGAYADIRCEQRRLDERIKFLVESDREMCELYRLVQFERDELLDETIALKETIKDAVRERQARGHVKRGVTSAKQQEVELFVLRLFKQRRGSALFYTWRESL